MNASNSEIIDLASLRTKLEILVNNANRTPTTASPEVMSYFRDLQELWKNSYADPAVQDVIRSVLLARFMHGGKFLHEYASGTIGDMLTSCFAMTGILPTEVQSCIPACLFGVTPTSLPRCTMQVWQEGITAPTQLNGSGAPLIPVNAIPGQPIVERSSTDASRYANTDGTALVILRSKNSLSGDDIEALRQAGARTVRTLNGLRVSDPISIERSASQSSTFSKIFWILLFLAIVFVGIAVWRRQFRSGVVRLPEVTNVGGMVPTL